MALKNPFWGSDNPIWSTKRIDFAYLETLVISPKKRTIVTMYENLYDANLQISYPSVRDLQVLMIDKNFKKVS